MIASDRAAVDLAARRSSRRSLSAVSTVIARAGRTYRLGKARPAALMVSRRAPGRSVEHGVAQERRQPTDPNRMARNLAFWAAFTVGIVHAASAQTVVDAKTIMLHGTMYRLWGIDAPDREQTCSHDWPAGAQAMNKLIEPAQGKKVECEERGHDRKGRALAVCRADGADLGAAMVRAGMAWADLAVSRAYVLQEARAAADYVGVHAYHCKTAWEWRATNGAPAGDQPRHGQRGK